MKKIKDFFLRMVTDRNNGINSKIFCGLIGFVVLIIGLFVGVDSQLYYIFAMCDVFYFGGSVIDNWTAPKMESVKTENKQSTSTTTTDVTSMVNNMVDKVAKK